MDGPACPLLPESAGGVMTTPKRFGKHVKLYVLTLTADICDSLQL